MNNDKKYEICRLCGYVRSAGKGGICPACGAPEKAFLPFIHKASESRRVYLKLDIHPVVVHFSISYVATTTLVFLLSLITNKLLDAEIDGILNLLIILLPLLVIAGGATGIIDGKVRYRKIQTPFLIRKILTGIFLFIVSIIILFLHIINTDSETILTLLEGLFIFIAMASASYLGWIGSKLVCPIVPRGNEVK